LGTRPGINQHRNGTPLILDLMR